MDGQISHMEPTSLTVVRGAGNSQHSSLPGRPLAFINVEQVIYLLNIGFKLSNVARMFLVHRTTLWRRLKRENIDPNQFSTISDTDLITIMQDITNNHPHTGVNMMLGHLKARGLLIQHRRVRTLLKMIDPAGCVIRWGCSLGQ